MFDTLSYVSLGLRFGLTCLNLPLLLLLAHFNEKTREHEHDTDPLYGTELVLVNND